MLSSSPPSSPSKYTPSDIQSHLYLSFLHGYTSDVSLHVQAKSWGAVYHLHRVVLIQAGFFRSLFTAGFLESQELRGLPYAASDDVYIHFDDVNITKAAFEICIARLYGGGPKLYVPLALLATPTHPLTPAFHASNLSFNCPADQHPATPHFLLSLLATSIYLSVSSVTSQALSLILSSIGPYTITRYLNFAIGKGIGFPDSADRLESAVGLEHIGKPRLSRPESRSSVTPSLPPDSLETSSQSESVLSQSDGIQKIGSLQLPPNADNIARLDNQASNRRFTKEIPPFNYGGIGDKIGESCACWLVRWGADMLCLEESMINRPTQSTILYSSEQVRHSSIWAQSGLSSSWACAVIASDDFFIKGEWERYEFATRVVQLRCRQKSDFIEEEADWTNLFTNGIQYCHLTFDELTRITQDISPFTGKPYVSIEVLHSAHWVQSALRHRILARPVGLGANKSSSPPPQNRDLGITITTSELDSNPLSIATGFRPPVVLYPVPSDTSLRIGDIDNAFSSGISSVDQLLGSVPSSRPQVLHSFPSQSNFFGILPPSQTLSSVLSNASGTIRWSPFPTFRFGVEFWGVDDLPEKSRIHSHTIWYAGSLFNVYVQVVKKKGTQLGIYLQRQSTLDPLPRPSSPEILKRERAATVTGYSNNIEQPVSRTITTMPSLISMVSERAVPGSPRLSPQPESPTLSNFHLSSLPSRSGMSTPTALVPSQPYRDPRVVISAHFTISCTTRTGSSLTRFTSSPDQFSVNQSWGWKSSSLRSDDGDTNLTKRPTLSMESSLRATVVLGLV